MSSLSSLLTLKVFSISVNIFKWPSYSSLTKQSRQSSSFKDNSFILLFICFFMASKSSIIVFEKLILVAVI